VDQQFQGREIGKAATVEQKRVNAEGNERLHLLNDLLGCAHEAKVILILSAIAIAADRFRLYLCRRADASAAPGTPHGRPITPPTMWQKSC
jgi:hypothetical protein